MFGNLHRCVNAGHSVARGITKGGHKQHSVLEDRLLTTVLEEETMHRV